MNESKIEELLKNWPTSVEFEIERPTIIIGYKRSKISFDAKALSGFYVVKEDGTRKKLNEFKIMVEMHPTDEEFEEAGFVNVWDDDVGIKALFKQSHLAIILSMLNREDYRSILKVDFVGLDDEKCWIKSKENPLRVEDVCFAFIPVDIGEKDKISVLVNQIKYIKTRLDGGVKVKIF